MRWSALCLRHIESEGGGPSLGSVRVVATGLVYDGRAHPSYGRVCRRTTLTRTADGTLLVSFRRGSDQRSTDGHPVLLASNDEGLTWTMRYDGYGRTDLAGVRGEMLALCVMEQTPGTLLATSLWIDRSDPSLPFQNPVTGGFLPMRIVHLRSRDGGRSWDEPRVMETVPHVAATPETNAALRLDGGVLVQPYGTWKEYGDPGIPHSRPYLRFSRDEGATWPEWVRPAEHPEPTVLYWDQRIAVHPVTRRLVSVFWTRDIRAERDLDAHVAWGSPDARTWTEPVPIGIRAQYFQPVALGGDRLAAVWVDREVPGVLAARSDDFGRTWDRSAAAVLYEGRPPDGPAAPGGGAASTFIGTTIAGYQFGHPRAVLLPGGDLLAVWYAGSERAMEVRWARVAL